MIYAPPRLAGPLLPLRPSSRRASRGPAALAYAPPPAAVLAVEGAAEGLYRVSDATLAGYLLYRGVDAAPDLDAAPWQTFAALPYTTPALAADARHVLVLRRRDAYGLVSRNNAGRSVDLDAAGDELPARPSDPGSVSVAPAAGGTVLVTARYAYGADGAAAADAWLIYLRSDGVDPDPAVDAAVEVPMIRADGVAKLSYTSAAFAEGATVKAIVRTRRSGTPDVDGVGSTIHAATATLLGPAAVVAGQSG